MLKFVSIAVAVLSLCSALSTVAAEPPAACGPAAAGRDAKFVNKMSIYATLLAVTEGRGRDELRPPYDAPSSVCALTSFAAGAYEVKGEYAGFTKGMDTLLYKFDATGAERAREMLVTYSGMLTMIGGAKGPLFAVTETSGAHQDIIAIYEREPTRAQMTRLAADLFAGLQKPLLTARWEDGEEEMIVDAVDITPLK